MTDITSSIIPAKLTGYELKKEINNRYYKNKVSKDPEFYEREKQRIKNYIVNRYKTDPEFHEKQKQLARERYYINKQKLLNSTQNIINVN
jgi:hypothetical protein